MSGALPTVQVATVRGEHLGDPAEIPPSLMEVAG